MISVLYVDDEPALLELGKIFLERIGKFSVETCSSAPEALERLEQASYHAVLSDYDMPDMNGIQFLKEVRILYPALPFIIFTGRGREDVVIDALNNGVDFYLQKGGEPKSQYAELSHKIRAAVGRRRSDEQVRHLARLYAVLSRTNDAATSIRDRDSLLAEVCRISVHEGGFLMVWAGLIDPETGTIRPVAHYSVSGNPALPPAEPGDALPLDAPPTSIAFRKGRFYIAADNREEPTVADWKTGLQANGFGSSAAFPLRSGEQVVGAMTFHAREPRFFDEEEVQLLLELTDNISIALELKEREQDVSELRQLSDALRSANSKLNLLNNIIRHDILNTVAGLLGLEDMALDILTDCKARELLQDMQNSTLKIQQQIAFTREYQTIGVHSPQWQNAEEVVTRARAQVGLKGIRFVTDITPVEIYADPLLEKVFYNLIENAVHYGEKITTIRFTMHEQPVGYVLTCDDDGIGIADELKERIFDQGYGRNTGQGLFLVREILAITGITICENGMIGQGARFEMIIPRAGAREADSTGSHLPQPVIPQKNNTGQQSCH